MIREMLFGHTVIDDTEKLLRIPVILRPATGLDARDTAIIHAVIEEWKRFGGATYRQLESVTGMSMNGIRYRMGNPGTTKPDGGLIGRGWLRCEAAYGRTIRPGPRFGGISRKHGTIYELVAWDK